MVANLSREKERKTELIILSLENNRTIEELARNERLAYFKEWRANNKDKVKKYNTAYWEKRAARKSKEKENKISD